MSWTVALSGLTILAYILLIFVGAQPFKSQRFSGSDPWGWCPHNIFVWVKHARYTGIGGGVEVCLFCTMCLKCKKHHGLERCPNVTEKGIPRPATFNEWWDRNIASVEGSPEAVEGLKEFGKRVWAGSRGEDYG